MNFQGQKSGKAISPFCQIRSDYVADIAMNA